MIASLLVSVPTLLSMSVHIERAIIHRDYISYSQDQAVRKGRTATKSGFIIFLS